MPVTITAKVECDRCEREQEMTIERGRIDAQSVIREANQQGRFGWKLLDGNAHEVLDSSHGKLHLLCSGCAAEYKAFVRRREESEREFFGKQPTARSGGLSIRRPRWRISG